MALLTVNNSNIRAVLPQIKDDIEQAVLICIDTELSGIASGDRLNGSFNSLEERYNNIKKIVHNYSVVQLGITFYRADKKVLNKYVGSTYSFHLFDNFNKAIGQKGRNITFDYKSLQFLTLNMFNIQEWAKDGLYFVKQSYHENFGKNFDFYLEEACFDLNREITNDIFYIISWLRQYKFEKSLYAKGLYIMGSRNRLKLRFKPSSNYLFNYFFVMKIRKFLLQRSSIDAFLENDEYLWCDNHNGEHFYVTVVKLVESEASEVTSDINIVPQQCKGHIKNTNIFEEAMKLDKEDLMKTIFSISTMFHLISQSKALVVGHNFFMDLLFIYHNFIDSLPDTFTEFSQKIHALFPSIYDTKLIAQRERQLKLRYTSLFECFVHLCLRREAFPNCVPDIFIRSFNDISQPHKDDFMNALDIRRFQKMQAHNAGFDSFVTGFVFLYFGFVLMRQAKPFNQRKSNRQILCDYRIFLEISCKPHCNKLYLPRNFNQPLSLDATVQTTAQIYSKVVLKFYNRLSLDIFQNLIATSSFIDCKRLSQWEFIVGATHSDKMELFLYGLIHLLEQNNLALSIKKYDDKPKLWALRKISRFAFLSSATCFTLLFTRFLLNRG